MKTVASSSVVSALRSMGGSLVLTAGLGTQDTSRTREVSVSITLYNCFIYVSLWLYFIFNGKLSLVTLEIVQETY